MTKTQALAPTPTGSVTLGKFLNFPRRREMGDPVTPAPAGGCAHILQRFHEVLCQAGCHYPCYSHYSQLQNPGLGEAEPLAPGQGPRGTTSSTQIPTLK